MLGLNFLTLCLRWRSIGPRCIEGTATRRRGAIPREMAYNTAIVAWTLCGNIWIAPIGIDQPRSLSLRRLRVTHNPHRRGEVEYPVPEVEKEKAPDVDVRSYRPQR